MSNINKKISIQNVFDGYAEKAKTSKDAKFVVDTKKRVKIEFTEDFKGFSKSEIIEVGLVAFDFYVRNGVAKEYK